MGRSKIGIFEVGTIDMQAPGAPALFGKQTSNHVLDCIYTPPTNDGDGSSLTGLTKGTAVVLEMSAAEAQEQFVDSDNWDGAMQVPGAQAFQFELDPNSSDAHEFSANVMNPGKKYTILGIASDDSPS